MNKNEFISLLKAPQLITQSQTQTLKAITKTYPYLQSARAIYLKGVKNFESFNYNKELKITAAHTTDRSILFDFITSDVFKQNEISEYIKNNNTLEDEELNEAKNSEIANETIIIEEIIPIENSEKPVTFNKNEKHSFNDWLNLTKLQPINRSEDNSKTNTTKSKQELKREEKFKLIDAFIEKNPKLRPKKSNTSQINIAKERTIKAEALMTETLAQIYVEQENYKKAIQSYKILSLKYPEKSSFFADRIKAIRQLQKNKHNTK